MALFYFPLKILIRDGATVTSTLWILEVLVLKQFKEILAKELPKIFRSIIHTQAIKVRAKFVRGRTVQSAKAHYYTLLVKGGCTIQGDVFIEKSALNQVGSTVNLLLHTETWRENLQTPAENSFSIEFTTCFTSLLTRLANILKSSFRHFSHHSTKNQPLWKRYS